MVGLGPPAGEVLGGVRYELAVIEPRHPVDDLFSHAASAADQDVFVRIFAFTRYRIPKDLLYLARPGHLLAVLGLGIAFGPGEPRSAFGGPLRGHDGVEG